MLMNHADSLINRIERVCDVAFLSPDKNLSFLAVLKTEQNFHQCCLAGSIFPNQRMDFTSIYREGNVLVCHKSVSVYLGDSFHSQQFFCHSTSTFKNGPPHATAWRPVSVKQLQLRGAVLVDPRVRVVSEFLELIVVAKVEIAWHLDLAALDLVLNLCDLFLDVLRGEFEVVVIVSQTNAAVCQ